MTDFKYIIRSLIHYRKQHLALLLGMAISSAVLTGALIVGDSIRYSLNNIVDTRLGETQFVISGGSRFMDVNLAGKLSQALQMPVAPVLMLQGIIIQPDSDTRINKAGIIGIDSSFNGICKSPIDLPDNDEVVIGDNVAERLNLNVGDALIIRVESAGLIPVNAPFAREPAPTVAFRLTVKAIATDDQLGRLNLSNDQTDIHNVFVSLGFLSQTLDLTGLANTLLMGEGQIKYSLATIEDSIQSHWSLKDLGLSVENRTEHGNYDLTSNRVFIDTIVQQTISAAGIPHQEIITYLVNDINYKGSVTPYSFVSAVPSVFTDDILAENDVIINKWTAEDLGAGIGDSITLSYFEIGHLRELNEKTHSFKIKNIISNTTNQIDSSLMPGFQGLSEAGNCRDWDAGVPIDLKRIRDKDEKYWDDYRGTPKVLISLETGKKLWKNQFGSLTTIRIQETDISENELTDFLTEKIKPSNIGLLIMDVRNEGAMAVKNAVNFTELFLGLSFFVIISGILLTMLMYSLHFSRRSKETALLSGLGFNAGKIIKLRFAETSLVILVGSITGSLLGILYNHILIAGLNTVWNDIVRTNMLLVSINPASLLTGVVISAVIAIVPIYRITSKKLKQPVAGQLKGYTESGPGITGKKQKLIIWGSILLVSSIVLVLYSLAVAARDNALLFLTAAALFLTGSLFVMYGILRSNLFASHNTVPTLSQLAIKNLKRNPTRSLAVISLLALGIFTIVLTGSYRKTYYGTENFRESGTGGYLLWAETTSPIPFNLNSSDGKSKLITETNSDLEGVKFLQFAKLEGDDASCLNLNQAQHPQILAVDPAVFDSVSAFSFVRLLPPINRQKPWKGLESSFNDSTFPAFADQNVIQYSLKRKLGDTLIYLNEAGKVFRLVITGSISNSVFQGNILVSDKVFHKQYPSSGGSKTFLIDAPESKQTLISGILNRSLIDYGIDVTSTSQRLATFNSVENTYLTVFMALSGLGFIIGTIGLGIVLLRNIFERKQELALMLSLGFNKNQIFKIVFAENFFLLATGFCTGMLAAFVGIIPSMLSPAFNVQGKFLIILTMGIFISGLLWIYFPLKSALNKPLIPALRSE